MLKLLLLTLNTFLFGCAVFTERNSFTDTRQELKTRLYVELSDIVKDFEGNDFYQLDTSVSKYAYAKLKGCLNSCTREAHLKVTFSAESNSKKSVSFKFWEWLGVLSLGIIPVIEKTNHKIITEITILEKSKKIIKENKQYIAFSIFLLPLNFFKNWKEDTQLAQKSLIDELHSELITNGY